MGAFACINGSGPPTRRGSCGVDGQQGQQAGRVSSTGAASARMQAALAVAAGLHVQPAGGAARRSAAHHDGRRRLAHGRRQVIEKEVQVSICGGGRG